MYIYIIRETMHIHRRISPIYILLIVLSLLLPTISTGYTIQQEEKIKNLEDKQKEINGLQQRISSLESLLTNLALNADQIKTEKVSLK